MHIAPDRSLIPAGSSSVRFLHVTVTAPGRPAPPEGGAPPRAGADVALVLNRSGSMGGAKMTLARKAVGHAVRLLGERDHLAVVAYDDRVETPLGRTRAGKAAKALALDRLAQIDARGSTDLSGGWLHGAALLAGPSNQAHDEPTMGERVKRVLLMTDGLANVGMVDTSTSSNIPPRFRISWPANSAKPSRSWPAMLRSRSYLAMYSREEGREGEKAPVRQGWL